MFGRDHHLLIERLRKQKASTAVNPAFHQALETPSAKSPAMDRVGYADATPAPGAETTDESGEQEQRGKKKHKTKESKKRKKALKRKQGKKDKKNPKGGKTKKGRKKKKKS